MRNGPISNIRARSVAVSYNARQVAKAYGCPIEPFDGTGVTIGVVELGGALNWNDLRKQTSILHHHMPDITMISMDGAQVESDGPDGADGEVMLDVEVIAAVAPGAKQRIYFAPNNENDFCDAIYRAVTECDYVSISWGAPESQWHPAAMETYEEVFAHARSIGVTVFVASGDTGSRDGTSTDVVDFPASSPSVVGCGGTRLTLDAQGKRAAEVTWDDSDTRSASGGGVSKHFPGRQVPDVAGNASPSTGYVTYVDGEEFVIGGTSAVAPLYAACCAVIREAYGKPFDFLNTILTNPQVCYDVTLGDNGGYKAGPGRDQVTGYGVVDFGELLAILDSGAQIPAPGGQPTFPLDTVSPWLYRKHNYTKAERTAKDAIKEWLV
jgi:kumamolisin